MKQRMLLYIAMMIAVPLAGELKLYPFEGNVRVSLGTPVFFLFLLWSRQLQPVLSGMLAGVSVVLFRITLRIFFDDMSFADALERHFPVFFYYFVFATMFHFLKLKQLHNRPLLIGIYGVLMEIGATLTEMGIRSFTSHQHMTLDTAFTIMVIAFIRSFFVLGFFNLLVLRESRIAESVQRLRNEEMLVQISNVYVEMIQLKKTMQNTEQLTSSAYSFYRELKAAEQHDFAKTALKFAGEIHEIKKDNQRIYAGLSKLMAKEKLANFMPINKIFDVIMTGNERYAAMLEKKISINANILGIHPSYNTFTILTMINNLVANAVEAIDSKGEIIIGAKIDLDMLMLQVMDDGPGISERNQELIFTPGFTTKFDNAGKASTGIGLSYVKDTIEKIGGTIILDSNEQDNHFRTIFTIFLPIDKLVERG
ncbi:sensor histidine kinase [Bacillus sp. DNRA2]|uniref:ATP-binding protein n=1 Tax=Bacillus sp. DNRA2 TaxID=2723053 RepID=UPI00145D723E|nr:sensor histidine kinase [Bacillus sp. DNRA2]NMD68746.1 sensor histidine kinase [Bacillus sp. DNRA2]